MRKIVILGCLAILLTSCIIPSLNATIQIDNTPPEITIVNPVEGYFHFSGIQLFTTPFDLIGDTMGFGGFRVKPVQAIITDDIDDASQISASIYWTDVTKPDDYQKERDMQYNGDLELFEGKWIGPALGTFYMEIVAEDSSGNSAEAIMTVWYFCFVPEP